MFEVTTAIIQIVLRKSAKSERKFRYELSGGKFQCNIQQA